MNRAEKRRQRKLDAKAAQNASPQIRTITLTPQQQTLTHQQATNLAIQHHKAGRLAEAESIYQQILRDDPTQHVAMHFIGVIAHQFGQSDVAIELISKALALSPDDAEANHNLAGIYKDLGRLDEAVAGYLKTLALKPDFAQAFNNLGSTLMAQNKSQEAFNCHQKAVTLAPGNESFWSDFAASMETLSFTTVDEKLFPILLQLLQQSSARPAQVVIPIISALRQHPNFAPALSLITLENTENEIAFADIAKQFSQIPLLIEIMELCTLYSLDIEQRFTILRRVMLQATLAGQTSEDGLAFSAALALQCFINEYTYCETDAEKSDVKQLEQLIAGLVKSGDDVPPAYIAALGTYRPLYYFSWAKELGQRKWVKGVRKLIDRQISQPLHERALRTQIPALTSIQDVVSKSVREQYEENPYPRWIKTNTHTNQKTIGAVIQQSTFGCDMGDYVSPEKPEALIAGCGTGQHILVTNGRLASARILAIDLSLSSLSYAKRKIDEVKLPNIEFAQADIMELASLERRFDLIESVGVLHHLGDPLAGWQVLANLLKPKGIMRIGLYSEIARQDIVAARDMIATQKYETTADDIRQCRQDVISKAKSGNLEMARICHRGDFFSLSDCRDLIFHVQEHRFTLLQIEEALESLNLKFVGFESLKQTTMQKVNEAHAKNTSQSILSHWHQYELDNPQTFTGMYQFWCQKI